MSFTLTEAFQTIEAETAKNVKAQKEKAENTFLAWQLLESEGLKLPPIQKWDLTYPVFYIQDPKNFVKVHRAIGSLVQNSVNAVGDGRTRKVEVYLKPKDNQFSHLRFRFHKKLPKGTKCKIVTTTRKESRVVCG